MVLKYQQILWQFTPMTSTASNMQEEVVLSTQAPTSHPASLLLLNATYSPNSVSPESYDICSNSDGTLQQVLSKLTYLDITAHVRQEGDKAKAGGGYSDIFIGSVYLHTLWRLGEVALRLVDIPEITHENGKFSSLESATLQRKVVVAIKRFRKHVHRSEDFPKLLAREISIWSKLRHPNVIPLLGYIIEDGYPSLISEWIDNGTLRKYAKDHPHLDILFMALEVSKGLAYLHANKIVHSDIKAENILVSQYGIPLISDFGISRALTSSLSIDQFSINSGSTNLKGTTRWMASEFFAKDSLSTARHTVETDIWAYGMTIYELLSKNIPYLQYKLDVHVMLAISGGELPIRPDCIDYSFSFRNLWGVCQSCWISDPRSRPTAKYIVRTLDKLRRDLLRQKHRTSSHNPDDIDQGWTLIDAPIP